MLRTSILVVNMIIILDTTKHWVSETVGVVVDVGREDDRLALPLVLLRLNNDCVQWWRSNRRKAWVVLTVVVTAEVYPWPVSDLQCDSYWCVSRCFITDLVVVTSDVGGALLVQRQGNCHEERGEKEKNKWKQNHPFCGSWLGGEDWKIAREVAGRWLKENGDEKRGSSPHNCLNASASAPLLCGIPTLSDVSGYRLFQNLYWQWGWKARICRCCVVDINLTKDLNWWHGSFHSGILSTESVKTWQNDKKGLVAM